MQGVAQNKGGTNGSTDPDRAGLLHNLIMQSPNGRKLALPRKAWLQGTGKKVVLRVLKSTYKSWYRMNVLAL